MSFMTELTKETISGRLDDLLKPPGSLARLEDLAAELCRIQQTLTPETKPRRVVLFAGDHDVAAQGVTAWPSTVTSMMLTTIRSGKSASAALAKASDSQIVLIDVGTYEQDGQGEGPSVEDSEFVQFLSRRVRSGARNLKVQSALTVDEFEQAFAIGRTAAVDAAKDGVRVIAAGEMGIGNTTSASCLAILLADLDVQQAVGRGAGVDDEGLAKKVEVVKAAVARTRAECTNDLEVIASVSGLEHVAMAGLFVGARESNLTVVLDGFVASSAALIAERLYPGIASVMIAAHQSAESGHAAVLEYLGVRPFLQWGMRLGEGTGALLLMPLLDAAAAIVTNMGTFSEIELAANSDA
jgi:nicotinate-nucleotide--dimethylbenzimidazole phosphoribosyltransferase